jgi:hypothetical protein
VRDVLGLPPYADFHKGKPITTMTYDFWVGRRGQPLRRTRFTLQEIFLTSLTNFLYDDGREPAEPSWWGVQKKEALTRWSSHVELLAMVEDTHDGAFYAAPHAGSAERPNAGPDRDRDVHLHASASSRCAPARPPTGPCADRGAARARPVHEARRDGGRVRARTRSAAAAWRPGRTSA